MANVSHNPPTSSSEKNSLQAQLVADLNPRRPWLNRFCTLVSYFTTIVALMMAVLEVCGFFSLTMTFLEKILCFYIILFCLLAVATETNLFNLTNDSKILKIWPLRGLLYIFIGTLGLNAITTAVVVQGAEFQRVIFRNMLVVLAYLMMSVGILYVIMGLLCFRIINDKLEHGYQERRTRAVEIKRTTDKYGAITDPPPQSIVV
jgi:hypothetical protein